MRSEIIQYLAERSIQGCVSMPDGGNRRGAFHQTKLPDVTIDASVGW